MQTITTEYKFQGRVIATATHTEHPFEDIDDTIAPAAREFTVENITAALDVTPATARKWLREGRLTTVEALEDTLAKGYDFHRNYSGHNLAARVRAL